MEISKIGGKNTASDEKGRESNQADTRLNLTPYVN